MTKNTHHDDCLRRPIRASSAAFAPRRIASAWKGHVQALEAENAALKLEVEALRQQLAKVPAAAGSPAPPAAAAAVSSTPAPAPAPPAQQEAPPPKSFHEVFEEATHVAEAASATAAAPPPAPAPVMKVAPGQPRHPWKPHPAGP